MNETAAESMNAAAASELAKKYFQQLQEAKHEIKRLSAILNTNAPDVEISAGHGFRLIDPA